LIVADFVSSAAQPFVLPSTLPGRAWELYAAAFVCRLVYAMTFGPAHRLRHALYSESGSGSERELFAAMEAFVEANDWRIQALTFLNWTLTAAATLTYVGFL